MEIRPTPLPGNFWSLPYVFFDIVQVIFLYKSFYFSDKSEASHFVFKPLALLVYSSYRIVFIQTQYLMQEILLSNMDFCFDWLEKQFQSFPRCRNTTEQRYPKVEMQVGWDRDGYLLICILRNIFLLYQGKIQLFISLSLYTREKKRTQTILRPFFSLIHQGKKRTQKNLRLFFP